MAPLSKEIRPISSCMPPHLGPAVPEVNTVWFKLFIYHLTGYGPPSLLLSKGMSSYTVSCSINLYNVPHRDLTALTVCKLF
jgi:hypothetical protein